MLADSGYDSLKLGLFDHVRCTIHKNLILRQPRFRCDVKQWVGNELQDSGCGTTDHDIRGQRQECRGLCVKELAVELSFKDIETAAVRRGIDRQKEIE